MENLTPTKFRDNFYAILDLIVNTGTAFTIVRNGKKIRIALSEESSGSKLANLKKRKVMKTNPEDYISLDWSNEWFEKNS